jgi:hypothetical protein
VIVDGNGVVDVSARANMKKFQKIRSESNIWLVKTCCRRRLHQHTVCIRFNPYRVNLNRIRLLPSAFNLVFHSSVHFEGQKWSHLSSLWVCVLYSSVSHAYSHHLAYGFIP